MPDSTKRILTDETGQDIVSALEALTNVMTTVSLTDVTNTVTNWLNDNIPTGQTVVVDQSLTISGAAADAKKTGDQFSDLESTLGTVPSGKTAQGQITDNANDIADLQSTSAKKSPAIYEEIESVPLATFADGAEDMPLKDLKVAIEPVQDLHGYDHPWPAGGGKNKLDSTLLINPTTTIQQINLTLKPNTAYTASTNSTPPTAGVANLFFMLSGETVSSSTNGVWANHSITLTTGDDGIAVIAYRDYSETQTSIADCNNQVEEGSQATSFAPYSNICPISGWTGANVSRTGKNLLLIDSEHVRKPPEFTSTWGTVTLVGNGFSTTRSAGNGGFGGCWAYVKAGSYAFSFDSDLTNANGSFGNVYFAVVGGTSSKLINIPADDGKTHRQFQITVPKDGILMMRLASSSWKSGAQAQVITFSNLQIELGSTATDYEPYQCETYDITFPSEAGTVYGGTLDVTTGELVVDSAMVYLGGLNWTKKADEIYSTTELIGQVKEPSTYAEIPDIICSQYVTASYNSLSTERKDDSITVIWSASGSHGEVWVRDSAFTDAETFKQAMADNNVQIVYALATPVTYTFTPQEVRTLLGQNNIWADAGDVSLLYPADTKAYIDNQIASTRKLIAGIETEFKASKAYSVGDMLIIGNDLYKVSASIASGATITVGTNVTKTTVAEQLIALANA